MRYACKATKPHVMRYRPQHDGKLRRNLPVVCGIISFTTAPTGEPRNHVGEFEQIVPPEHRTSLADDGRRIVLHDVGPLRRHRANVLIVDLEQQPLPVAVVPLAHTDKLPSAERVEWMRHSHKTCDDARRASNSD